MKTLLVTALLAAALLATRDAAAQETRYIPVERYVLAERHFPSLAVKTNILHDALFLAPSLGLEIGLGRRSSLDFSAAYAPASAGDKCLSHALARLELRGWHKERFLGHFLGAQILLAHYEINGHRLLSLFQKTSRYKGLVYGASVSYGYHIVLGRQWGLELGASAGALLFNYDEFDPNAPETPVDDHRKLYSGITGARVALVFIIN
jgi:hypothetical protein